MALAKVTFEVFLTEINCGECGGVYAINERYRVQQEQKGGCWTCPYCNVRWGYSNNSENARLKRQLDEQMREATRQAERARDSDAARIKAEKKLKSVNNRISKGVCPCCNRTFQNLARHMETKHKETK